MNQGRPYRSLSNCAALVINCAALMIAGWEELSDDDDDDCHFGQDLKGITQRELRSRSAVPRLKCELRSFRERNKGFGNDLYYTQL